MAILIPYPKFYATDENGEPLVGGQLFTYEAGTTTKRDTYTDASGGVENTNPVILDSSGLANVWIDPAYFYKFVLSPSTDTDPPTDPIWTVDDIGVTTPEGLRGLTFVSLTSSTTDADPGAGKFKWNNLQSSATQLYFDNLTSDGVSLTTFWASLPPGGFITLQQSDDSSAWQLWKWTATPVDGSGYRKFTVTLQATSGLITGDKLVLVSFVSRSANAALDALAGLTPAADKVAYFTSGTAAALADFPSVGRTLVAQTTQALARSTGLGLGTLTFSLMSYGGLAFNGTTTYLDGNALTGIADGKVGTFVWFGRFTNSASALEYIMHATGSQVEIGRDSSGRFSITLENVGSTNILAQTVSSPALAAGTDYCIMCSWNLATSTFNVYINDVSGTLVGGGTITDDTIDYTNTEYSLGASTTGTSFFTGDMSLVWFDPTTCQDFSSAAVRRKFSDANNVPIYLGRNGQLPTGTPPILFLAYDSAAQWPVNRGNAQATTFVQNGTIAAAGTVLYGQWAPAEAVGVIKTVVADYTLLSTDRQIINNRAATNTLTLPDPTTCKNRELWIRTIQAQTVVSAGSNVVPIIGGSAGTAILTAADGAWAYLVSDGTSWQIMGGVGTA